MAAIVTPVQRKLVRELPDDDLGDDLSAFKQLPSEEERLLDLALNVRLRG